MSEQVLTPPKWLRDNPEQLAAAYRRGVALAIWYREKRVTPSIYGHMYIQAPGRWLRFADRVAREWMRRHPAPAIPGEGETNA